MAGLIERVARIADPSLWQLLDFETKGGIPPQDDMAKRQREGSLDRAHAAVGEVLAAMREPSEAVRKPFLAWKLFGFPKLEGAWTAAVDIRAREHGL
jgi:hypothetical protein